MAEDDRDKLARQGISLNFTVGPKPTSGGADEADEAGRTAKVSPVRIEPTDERESLYDGRAFRTLVLGNFQPGADYATSSIEPVFAQQLSASTLDAWLEEMAPSLAVELDDPVLSGKKLRVDLAFRSLKDFKPRHIAAQVPELRALPEASKILAEWAAGGKQHGAALADLKRLLPNAQWAEALLARTPGPEPQKSSHGGPTVEATGNPNIDRLLEQVDLGPSKRTGGDLLARVAFDGSKQRSRATAGATAASDAFINLLRQVLQHPELHRLETAFRGLRLLLERAGASSRVEVLSCREEEAPAGLVARTRRQSEPLDLVVWDAVIDTEARSLELLESMGEVAETLQVPVVTSGTSRLLGLPNLAALSGATRSFATQDDESTTLFRSACGKPWARWVSVALNGVLVRSAYDSDAARVDVADFAQSHADERSACFAAPAYAVGGLVVESFAKNGQPYALTDARTGLGSLDGFAVHETSDRDAALAIPTEVYISRDTHVEAARAGITVWSCRPNRDAILVERTPMLFRESTPGGSRAANARLVDQLLVGRLVRAMKTVAQALPLNVDPQKGRDVALIVLREFFHDAPPNGPEFDAKVQNGQLQISVATHRYHDVGLGEFGFALPLGE